MKKFKLKIESLNKKCIPDEDKQMLHVNFQILLNFCKRYEKYLSDVIEDKDNFYNKELIKTYIQLINLRNWWIFHIDVINNSDDFYSSKEIQENLLKLISLRKHLWV
jgi:hypothetical protein